MKIRKLKKKIKFLFNIRKNVIVLMYHRVNEINIDPWQLVVSPENFEQHLRILKDSRLVVPLDELKRNLLLTKKLKPSIVITFDDGYNDNFLFAKPLLEKYKLPATFFLTNIHIGESKEFWWDEMAHLVLETFKLPKEIRLQIGDKLFCFDLEDEAILNDQLCFQNKNWDAENEPPTLRARLYLQLWKKLSPLTYMDQQAVMDQLRICLGVEAHRKTKNYCMSESQLLSLASNDLFTIGGHTNSHPLLSAHDLKFQIEEIGSNKQYLERMTNQKINSFAYPSGRSNDDTEKALKNFGFDFAFNTRMKGVQKEDDPFQIGRFQVNNWDKYDFKRRLGYWLV